MKNYIDYYYGFNIFDLSFSNGIYFFSNLRTKYMLKICKNINDCNYLFNLSESIIANGYINFFKIIKNKEDKIITLIEGKPYILLKISNIKNDIISIFDIKSNLYVDVNNNFGNLIHYPWEIMWENKIDYFENWFLNKFDIYKDLYPIFNYFIGVAENALLYLKEVNANEIRENSDNLVVSHSRININTSLFEYYDSTNLIIDHSSRDVSEYIKSCFINHCWDIDILREYLKNHYFSNYGLKLLFSRILFPSFFFDYIEKMITDNTKIIFLDLENRVVEFQNFIRDISFFLIEEYNINGVAWILKKI